MSQPDQTEGQLVRDLGWLSCWEPTLVLAGS